MSFLRRLLAPRADSTRALASGTVVDQFLLQGGGIAGGRWVNPASGLGGPMDRAQSDQYVSWPTINHRLADALLETNGVGRRIVFREPEDCTREGYDITGVEPALAEAIEDACDGAMGLDCLSSLCTARAWARAFGGGAIVMMIDDGREPWQPVDMANIRALRGLLTADRWELPVAQFGTDPREPRTFGQPRVYQLQPAGAGVAATMVHADRVIRMRGMTLPLRSMIIRQGWEGSIFDLVFAQLRSYGVSHALAAEALSMLSQDVLSNDWLDAALEADEGPAVIQQRAEAMRAGIGMFGMAVLGKGEEYQIRSRSLTGVKDVIEAAVNALVVVAGMPRAVLLGEVPGGLGHGERSPELGIWYDHCRSLQPRVYTPALRRILEMLLRSAEGPTRGVVPPGLGVEWRPLWQETEDQKADREVKQSQRRMTDIASGVVSADEVRRGDRALQETYDLDPAEIVPARVLPGDEPGLAPDEGVTVQEAALNGAQVKSLLEVVQLTQAGELPRDAAIGIIGASFPLLRGQEERVLGSAGELAANTSPEAFGPVSTDDGPLLAPGPSEDPIPGDLVPARIAAKRFGVPTNTITRLTAKGPDNGGIRFWGLGSHKQVSMAEVAAVATAHQVEAEG